MKDKGNTRRERAISRFVLLIRAFKQEQGNPEAGGEKQQTRFIIAVMFCFFYSRTKKTHIHQARDSFLHIFYKSKQAKQCYIDFCSHKPLLWQKQV